jgi:hypothetical protein
MRATIGPKRRQSGQALLESTFTLVTTLLLVLGTLDLGQVMIQLHFFGERARETARWAATHDVGPDGIIEIQRWATGGEMFGLSRKDVTVTVLGIQGTSDYRVQVAITKLVHFFSPFLWGNSTALATAATAPIESAGAAE